MSPPSPSMAPVHLPHMQTQAPANLYTANLPFPSFVPYHMLYPHPHQPFPFPLDAHGASLYAPPPLPMSPFASPYALREDGVMTGGGLSPAPQEQGPGEASAGRLPTAPGLRGAYDGADGSYPYRSSPAPQEGMHGTRGGRGGGRGDSSGDFALDLQRLQDGSETRTTLMVRNIPNKYSQQMLLDEVNAHHQGQYDFFYLPIDFKNRCNVGYAFINFLSPLHILDFVRRFEGQRWRSFNSEKICSITYARIQGKAALVSRFQNSSLLDKDDTYKPLLFRSSGPEQGQPEPFPAPSK